MKIGAVSISTFDEAAGHHDRHEGGASGPGRRPEFPPCRGTHLTLVAHGRNSSFSMVRGTVRSGGPRHGVWRGLRGSEAEQVDARRRAMRHRIGMSRLGMAAEVEGGEAEIAHQVVRGSGLGRSGRRHRHDVVELPDEGIGCGTGRGEGDMVPREKVGTDGARLAGRCGQRARLDGVGGVRARRQDGDVAAGVAVAGPAERSTSGWLPAASPVTPRAGRRAEPPCRPIPHWRGGRHRADHATRRLYPMPGIRDRLADGRGPVAARDCTRQVRGIGQEIAGFAQLPSPRVLPRPITEWTGSLRTGMAWPTCSRFACTPSITLVGQIGHRLRRSALTQHAARSASGVPSPPRWLARPVTPPRRVPAAPATARYRTGSAQARKGPALRRAARQGRDIGEQGTALPEMAKPDGLAEAGQTMNGIVQRRHLVPHGLEARVKIEDAGVGEAGDRRQRPIAGQQAAIAQCPVREPTRVSVAPKAWARSVSTGLTEVSPPPPSTEPGSVDRSVSSVPASPRWPSPTVSPRPVTAWSGALSTGF